MKNRSLWFSLVGVGVALFVACSADPPVVDARVPNVSAWPEDDGQVFGGGYETISAAQPVFVRPGEYPPPIVERPEKSPSAMYREVNVKRDYMPYGSRGRSRRRMSPRYVTIHSTQNWSRGADAWRHSLALKRGALGRISWHYTVDEYRAVQHLPTTEQGNHADHNGPGNRTSIGIEMCEHPGNSRSQTMERTAKLAAWLCVKHDIPVRNVVPHYKWPRWGKNPPNKNCPHFLMTNGRPGSKWRGFVKVVERYHQQMTGR